MARKTTDETETAAEAPVEPQLDEVTDPTELVASAEREAVEAEELVDTLERQFIDGDETVDQEKIEKQRGIAGFARLAVARARVRADRLREARRVAALKQIVAEVDEHGHGGGIGVQLAEALREVQKAEQKFLAIGNEHDARVKEWRERAMQFGARPDNGWPVGPAEDGGIAVSSGPSERTLLVGRRWLRLIGTPDLLKRWQKVAPQDAAGYIAGVELLGADAPAGETVAYQNVKTGAVFHFATDRVPSHPDLKQVTRAEVERS